ncbi:hypothetical protein J2S10_004352 [Neobacillus ginsengisoli]|uniref:Uncharacterized protein n=1 Tax=Neobacillus ginsengisoli TaxID=904295 RepID=A0ABT9Y071_9BACI|nr:hypothetical protein [Neobacillus ginsengisoli]
MVFGVGGANTSEYKVMQVHVFSPSSNKVLLINVEPFRGNTFVGYSVLVQ